MSKDFTLNGRIEYPKELDPEIQEIIDLVNQGEQEEAFRRLRELQKQGEVEFYFDGNHLHTANNGDIQCQD